MFFSTKCWSLLGAVLASLYVAQRQVVGDEIIRNAAASSFAPLSSDGASVSGHYVRLQLEDLELPDGDSVTTVQHDDDVLSSSPGGITSDCLPLKPGGDLSTLCTRSAARYPDLFDHVDEEHSSVQLRQNAGDWLAFLRSPSFSRQNVHSSSATTTTLCRDRLRAFTCAMYAPPCASRSHRQTSDTFSRQISCRQMCESARTGCSNDVHRQTSSVLRDWPDKWDCGLLPRDLMCDYSLHGHQRSAYGTVYYLCTLHTHTLNIYIYIHVCACVNSASITRLRVYRRSVTG